jgi:hypothetical protein
LNDGSTEQRVGGWRQLRSGRFGRGQGVGCLACCASATSWRSTAARYWQSGALTVPTAPALLARHGVMVLPVVESTIRRLPSTDDRVARSTSAQSPL